MYLLIGGNWWYPDDKRFELIEVKTSYNLLNFKDKKRLGVRTICYFQMKSVIWDTSMP